jgi:hypothetical protein
LFSAPVAAGVAPLEGFDPLVPGAARVGLEARMQFDCATQSRDQRCRVPAPPALPDGVAPKALEVLFRDQALAQVQGLFDEKHHAGMLARLRAALGPPEDRSFRTRAGMAGAFEAGVHVWSLESATGNWFVVLEQYAGKIDRSALTWGDEPAMRSLLERVRRPGRGEARDL